MPTSPASRPCHLLPHEGERIVVGPESVRILADAQSTAGQLLVMEITSPPGMGPPLHRHTIDDEFFFVLEGTYKFVRDGVEVIAQAGAFVACPRGSRHAFRNISSAPGRLLVICTPPGLEDPFREVHRTCTPGSVDPAAFARIFGRFQLTIEGPPLAP